MFVTLAASVWMSRGDPRSGLWVLKFLAAYGAVSMLTLPFMDAFWLGEIPVLTIVQLPKIEFARAIRRLMVSELMGPVGLSQGSFSPDYIAARPWALAITYALPLSLLLGALWIRTRLCPPYRLWSIAVVLVALLDYWLTLVFASGPGLSVY